MNRLIFIGIGIIVLSLFSVIIFMSRSADDKSSDTEVFDTSSFDMSSLKIPKTPKNWSQEEFDKKWAEEMAKADALLNEDIPIDMDEVFSGHRLDSITDADLAEVELILSKLKSLDNLSKSAIIDALLSFYPVKDRDDLNRQFIIRYSRLLDKLYQDRLTDDQKLEAMAHYVQARRSEFRDMDMKIAEAMRRREELLKSDPDLYYDTEIQKYTSEIPETEELIRRAEARGDTVRAESHRNHLLALHEHIDFLDYRRNFDANIEASVQEYLKEWHKNGDEFRDELYAIGAELDKLDIADMSSSVDTSVPVSDSSSDSSSVSLDSVPSTNSVPVASVPDFSPVFSDIDKKYSDVILSMSLSERDLSKLSVSSRELLRSRTSEMQRTVVSELRKTMVSMKNVSETKKRELVYDFVMKSYNKEFATSVLRQLNTDTK